MIYLNINSELIRSIITYATEVITLIAIVAVSLFILLDNSRNPIKSISWLLVIIFIPVIGILLYFFIGRNYRKNKIFSRKEISDLQHIEKHLGSKIITKINMEIPNHIKIKRKEGIINLLRNNNKAFLTFDNNVQVLNNGTETFNSILSALNSAQNHIHLEYYIIEDGLIANKIRDILIKKANEGVIVRLIYDDLGSWGLSNNYINSLKKAGVRVFPFMPVRFHRLATKINYRNHRKIVVVDGKIGFVGGLNIADRYLEEDLEIGFWRDTHLRIEGSAVETLQLVFLTDWYFVSDRIIDDSLYFPKHNVSEECLVQIASSGPDSDWASIKQAFFYAISTAHKYIFISTPYFMPDESILMALKTASLSGVDIRILMPSKSDSHIAQWCSMSYIEELLEANIKIYVYKIGFTHSKLIIIDDIFSSVGTANMDIRSFDQNFEINALIYNEAIAISLKKSFKQDIKTSEQILLDNYSKRSNVHKFKESLARIVSPLL